MTSEISTTLCRYTESTIAYGDRDLIGDLMDGSHDFVEVMLEQILGRGLSRSEIRTFNILLIAMLEHGFTPSSIATRLVYMSAPENLQGAVAAGLMAVGSQFVGTAENCATLLARMLALAPAEREAEAEAIVEAHERQGRRVPGFGHNLHRPEDPRAVRLIEIGREMDGPHDHLDALELLGAVLNRRSDKRILINASGASAALMGDMGVPLHLMRGVAVIARAAGLVAHVAEERTKPAARAIWGLVNASASLE